MSTQDLLAEIRKLSVERQKEILDSLIHSLAEAPSTPDRAPNVSLKDAVGATEAEEDTQNDERISRLRGIIRTDGPLPGDAELREDYTRYLMEKYQ